MTKNILELKSLLFLKKDKSVHLNNFKMWDNKSRYMIKSVDLDSYSIILTIFKLKEHENLKISKIKFRTEVECI